MKDGKAPKILVLAMAVFATTVSACNKTSIDTMDSNDITTSTIELISEEPITETTDTENQSSESVTEEITTKPITTKPITTKPITTKPITTKPVTTKPITTKSVTTKSVTTKPVTTKPVTTKPIANKTSGYNTQISNEVLRLTNEYRTANGLSASYDDGGWQRYADRMTKFIADNYKTACIHGLGIHEVYVSGHIASAEEIMRVWKKSAGHNDSILDRTAIKGKYIAVSYYHDEINHDNICIMVLMDTTYEEYYNSYGHAIGEEQWYEHGGMWNQETDDFILSRRTWTEEQVKSYFDSHGYAKHYPHLAG